MEVERSVWSRLIAIAVVVGALCVACEPAGPFVSKHVLELHADASIHCDGREISVPGDDTLALRAHLHEAALEMPRAPIFADHPNGPKSPNGRLDLRIDTASPCGVLLRATEACMQPGIQIWNLRLLTTTGGVAGRSISLDLPRDIGVSQCPTDIEGQPIKVRIRPWGESAGAGRLAYTVSCPIKWSTEGSDSPAVIYENHDAQDASELKRELATQHARWPARAVDMDPPADLSFAPLLETIDLGFQVGFSRVSVGLVDFKR